MKTHLTIILIGLVSGFIGILPLFRKKADRYSLLAAFLLFFMMPYVVYHFHLPWAAWWWKGMVISGALALAVLCLPLFQKFLKAWGHVVPTAVLYLHDAHLFCPSYTCYMGAALLYSRRYCCMTGWSCIHIFSLFFSAVLASL